MEQASLYLCISEGFAGECSYDLDIEVWMQLFMLYARLHNRVGSRREAAFHLQLSGLGEALGFYDPFIHAY